MDEAKLRLLAGAGAAIFGLVGVGCLAVAAVYALEPVFGDLGAVVIAGLALSLIAVGLALLMSRPDTSSVEDVAEIEALTAEALADLPFDTVRAMIDKRPIASLAIAATTGYALSRDPQAAAEHVKRAVTTLMAPAAE